MRYVCPMDAFVDDGLPFHSLVLSEGDVGSPRPINRGKFGVDGLKIIVVIDVCETQCHTMRK